jgi:hypothetical protein
VERRKEEQKNPTAAEDPVVGEVDTPVACIPQDLPTANGGVDDAASSSQATDTPSTVSSPTLSISTNLNSTPTELGEDAAKGTGEQAPAVTRHETFYLEDGNIEILCGDTVFMVHSPIVSFSSPKLRDALSNSTSNGPTSEGCPRVVFEDSAEDFAILLKMIYTPG